ncbi:acylphosphatase [Acidipropionibacterium jensenii]|uniref:acylphosphatase n=1 Tax=Acidipropionibacterium jensenii TaxID=1749 RepID=A0A3T0S3V4_9ACTN|nr:acylphosphatase [Acidipropionibacterium jensenii]AZZ38516.1 acylphosphatase [Acidipropionibacterium jensenii]AZZ41045.1 acylphosphatase [Acidipropionibacterium jensenii]MDN5976483.1 acylphosphatase [Acidipropionibacterium jensenii]MDN5995539.1 acylphosphatase [Acidipropionibacterium jensenii]MDN6021917.1 acylphosphatase [Acidipropionibacterium jensenii]
MSTVHVHVIVRGRVQGVGFRWFTQSAAESLGVAGTVRNCADGTVKAELEGPEEDVDSVVAMLHRGPGMSRVDGVETMPAAVTGMSGFRVTG